MTTPAKEKCYFGCVPKDQLDPFLQTLAKGIKEGKKSGDKKDFELEIRGSKKTQKEYPLKISPSTKLDLVNFSTLIKNI